MYFVGARIFAQLFMLSPPNQVIAEKLPGTPHSTELVQNISFVFINSDFSLDYPRPIVPNVAYIGCVQCHPPKALPKELEDFMQSSGDDGVIVFSMGATFNSQSVPASVVQEILSGMGRMKQKVIMKLDAIPSASPPTNVLLTSWFPQQDILGHNKTRLFITHCGMHGVMEAIYHKVPMLGIPLFADQIDICKRVVVKGIGVQIHKFHITAELLQKSMQQILTNDSYSKNAKKLSVLLHDQVQTPLNRAIHWVEYVIRHNGAEHLKSADRFLNIFQYLLVDIIITSFILLAALMYIIVKVFRICKRNSKQVHLVKNGYKKTAAPKKLKKT